MQELQQQIGVYKLYALKEENIIKEKDITIGIFSIGDKDFNSKRAFWELTRSERENEEIQEMREYNLKVLALQRKKRSIREILTTINKKATVR